MSDNKLPKHLLALKLPIPDETVILSYIDKAENPDLIVDRYLTLVENTAKLEADTFLKGVKVKYGFYWKIVAIICALVFLICGILCGYKLRPYWEKAGIECTPTQNK